MKQVRLPILAHSPKVETVTNPKWDGMDITSQLEGVAQTPHVFHKLSMGRIGVAVYLFAPAFGKQVLEHKPDFHHNTLEVYNILLGAEGIHVGYLFRSPLRLKLDPYYVMFVRRSIEVISDVIRHPNSVEKRYVLNELVFHTHATSYLITRVEENSVTRMLGQ
jgi:hypothetical protein